MVLKSRQQDSQESILQQSGQQRRQRQRREPRENSTRDWLALPRPGSLRLGWALQDKDKQLERQVWGLCHACMHACTHMQQAVVGAAGSG